MSTIEEDTAVDVPLQDDPTKDPLKEIFRKIAEEWAQLHRDTLRMYMQRIRDNVFPTIQVYVPSEKNQSDIHECMTNQIELAVNSIVALDSHMPFTTVENTPELAARVAKVLSEKPVVITEKEPKEPPKEREAGKVYSEKEMKAMTVTDLKVICKSFGLTTSGKKDDVIKRITTYHNNLISEEISVSEVVPDTDNDPESESDADQESGSDLELVDPDPDSSDPDV